MSRFFQAPTTEDIEYISPPTATPAAGGGDGVGGMLGGLEVLPEDRERMQERMGAYQAELDEVAEALRRNPQAGPQFQGKIQNIRNRFQKDFFYGDIAEMRDRYAQMQEFMGSLEKVPAHQQEFYRSRVDIPETGRLGIPTVSKYTNLADVEDRFVDRIGDMETRDVDIANWMEEAITSMPIEGAGTHRLAIVEEAKEVGKQRIADFLTRQIELDPDVQTYFEIAAAERGMEPDLFAQEFIDGIAEGYAHREVKRHIRTTHDDLQRIATRAALRKGDDEGRGVDAFVAVNHAVSTNDPNATFNDVPIFEPVGYIGPDTSLPSPWQGGDAPLRTPPPDHRQVYKSTPIAPGVLIGQGRDVAPMLETALKRKWDQLDVKGKEKLQTLTGLRVDGTTSEFIYDAVAASVGGGIYMITEGDGQAVTPQNEFRAKAPHIQERLMDAGPGESYMEVQIGTYPETFLVPASQAMMFIAERADVRGINFGTGGELLRTGDARFGEGRRTQGEQEETKQTQQGQQQETKVNINWEE